MESFFDFDLTLRLALLISDGLLAAAVLGLVAGIIGPLIVIRRMAFAVHGTAELAFTGAAAALLFVGPATVAFGAVGGAIVAALLLGLLGGQATERDSVIGVVLSFGLGIGVLLLWFYPGRAANKLGLLVGQVVSVDSTTLMVFAVCGALVIGVLALIYRPLLFASVDPVVAAARGVPNGLLTPIFAVLVGISAALGVQVVGVLLVLALLVTPAAAALRVTSSPLKATVLSVVFAEVAVVGGILLSLAPGAPPSPFVTTISFLIYLVCRAISWRRSRAARHDESLINQEPAPVAAR